MAKSYSFTDFSGIPYQYTIVREIGRGTFGVVSEATETIDGRPTGRTVAVKECEQFEKDQPLVLEEISKKLQGIRRIENENVTRYYHTLAENGGNYLQPSVKTTVIMEYCELGTVENYIAQKNLSNDQIKDLVRQILNGLHAIHSHKVIHMDLKTANIVTTASQTSRYGVTAKITDLDDHFALSATITKSYEVNKIQGTLIFMSPEMLNGGRAGYQIGKKTDIWSMGCIIVELYRKEAFRFVKLINGKPNPADVLIVREAMQHAQAIETFIRDGGVPEIPPDIPDVARTMIEECFKMDPSKRPSARDLLHSVWFENRDAPEVPVPSKAANTDVTSQVSEVPRHEFLLRNTGLIPNPNREMHWDYGVNCGARVLVHHIPHTHFPAHYYTGEVAQVKKNIDPGQPIDDKYKQLLLKVLRDGHAASRPNPLTQLLNSVVQSFLESSAPRVSALLSLILPTIGPSFPNVAVWMNKYTKEYEYVCKGKATWKDIRPLVDVGQPVIAQLYLRDLKMSELVTQAFAASGCATICPPTFPNISAVIVRGYEGRAANGEPHTVIYTTCVGETAFMPYEEFKKCANWESTHPLTKEAFDLSEYEPAQIIYRVKKGSAEDEPD